MKRVSLSLKANNFNIMSMVIGTITKEVVAVRISVEFNAVATQKFSEKEMHDGCSA